MSGQPGPSYTAGSDQPDTREWQRIQEQGMKSLLQDMGLSEIVQEKFNREKIYIPTVKLLTDSQLSELGVDLIGDKAELRRRCHESEQSTKVSSQVRSIMGTPLPGSSYSPVDRSLPRPPITFNAIPCRPKRKSKGDLASSKYLGTSSKKGKTNVETFQRKLIVFKYMADPAPKHFTRRDEWILMRGMLPEIPIDAPEEDVRSNICDVIKNCSEPNLSGCQPSDFEFIDMSGKHASVPNFKSGQAINCRTVKKLAGTGSLYVRMTREISNLDTGGSNLHEPDVVVVKVEPGLTPQQASTSEYRYTYTPSLALSTPQPEYRTEKFPMSGPHGGLPSAINRPDSPSYCPQLSSTSSFVCSDNELDSSESLPDVSAALGYQSGSTSLDQSSGAVTTEHPSIQQLADMFPQVSDGQLKFLLASYEQNTSKVMHTLLEGLSMDSLRDVVRSTRIRKSLCDSPRLRVDADDEEGEWVDAAVSFYKASKFDKEGQLRVYIRGQPGVDTGGLRRQFFSVVFETLATSESFKLFEGSANRLRPTFRLSNLSSGLLRVIGTMVAHSYLLDGQGFPFLSDCCYYHLCGCTDKAMSAITLSDVGDRVSSLLTEVQDAESDSQLAGFHRIDELIDLMQQSGCDQPLQLKHKVHIVESIMVYEALHKRKVFLDAFGEGLDEFGVWSLMRKFPEEMKEAFVPADSVSASDVMKIVKPIPGRRDADEERVWGYLTAFVRNSTEKDLKNLIQFVTGCSEVRGNRILVRFSNEPHAEAVVAHTCSRELHLSSRITDEATFTAGMMLIIKDKDFTIV